MVMLRVPLLLLMDLSKPSKRHVIVWLLLLVVCWYLTCCSIMLTRRKSFFCCWAAQNKSIGISFFAIGTSFVTDERGVCVMCRRRLCLYIGNLVTYYKVFSQLSYACGGS